MALLIVATGGTATWAAIAQPSFAPDSEMTQAGLASRDAVHADGPAVAAVGLPAPAVSTAPTAATAPPPPGTAASAATAPGGAPPPSTPAAVSIAPPIPSPTDLVGWPPAPPPPPPVVVQTGPASWKFEDKGVTITASVTPAAPRVGDTVTISFTTAGEGDLCCRAFVFVGGALIGHSWYAEGEPCPPPPVKSGTASTVVSEPGPFRFIVEATRAPAGCIGPHEFTNVNLPVTLQVLPA